MRKHKSLRLLQTPTGRARVRAIRHINWGSHRVFIILSEFATRESLDDLVTLSRSLLDELNPVLSGAAPLVAEPAAGNRRVPLSTTSDHFREEIAGRAFPLGANGSGQLKTLRDKGYVTAASVGRSRGTSWPQPLMACVEVKDPQRRADRLMRPSSSHRYDRRRRRLDPRARPTRTATPARRWPP